MANRALIYLIISVVCFFIATSCGTEKRLQRAEVLLASKGKLAEICASRFPPKDSVVYRDSVRWDTLYEGIYSIDTVYDKDTVKVYVTLPAKIVTKEVVKFRDVYRENTAKVVELQNKNADCLAKNADYERQLVKLLAQSNDWEAKAKARWWFLWILVIISLVIVFRKTIFKLVRKALGSPI
jgi:hypothetical protein